MTYPTWNSVLENEEDEIKKNGTCPACFMLRANNGTCGCLE